VGGAGVPARARVWGGGGGGGGGCALGVKLVGEWGAHIFWSVSVAF